MNLIRTICFIFFLCNLLVSTSFKETTRNTESSDLASNPIEMDTTQTVPVSTENNQPIVLNCDSNCRAQIDTLTNLSEMNFDETEKILSSVETTGDIFAMLAAGQVVTYGDEGYVFFSPEVVEIEIIAIASRYWLDMHHNEDENKDLQDYGYFNIEYKSYLFVFVNDDLVNVVGSFDRIQYIRRVEPHISYDDNYLYVETMLDGGFIYTVRKDGALLDLATIHYYDYHYNSAIDSNLFLYDVDEDSNLEALVFLKYKPNASVNSNGIEYFLSWVNYPFDQPITDLTTGIVSIELDGTSEHPFTYYPELILK